MAHYATLGRQRDSAPDPDALPLAVPAAVIASIMLIGVVAAAAQLPHWARDYGEILVYPAVVVHVVLAVRLLWWGIELRRTSAGDPTQE